MLWIKRLPAIIVLEAFSILIALSGCAQFPRQPIHTDNLTFRSWNIRGLSQCDYFQYLDAKGRIVRLGFDDDQDGRPDTMIDLATITSDESCPHYVFLLDGVPFKVLDAMYREGHFRFFHPPSKLISVFPSNTDTAYSEIFTPGCLLGYEAQFYDRQTHRMSDGNAVYLRGENEPWGKLVDYRVPLLLDPVGYVKPNFLFDHEMNAIERKMRANRRGTLWFYSVGTAMVLTRQGEPGIRRCLQRVENLCEKILYEHRGRCRFSLLADHGHTLTPAAFFDAASVLKRAGFRVTNRLEKPNDVAVVQFGLVTYAALYTDEPEKAALCLLDQEPVELALYPQELNGRRNIVVRDRQGMALVEKHDGRYRYEPIQGDPLKLKPIIEQLGRNGQVDRAGGIDDRALFHATVDHVYPDPLARIWRAFNGLVRHPADLVVTLNDEWFAGNPSFARSVNVASTHGALNGANSVTAVMSTIRPLAPAIRIEELPREFPEINRP